VESCYWHAGRGDDTAAAESRQEAVHAWATS
jgi:hypothetical protein